MKEQIYLDYNATCPIRPEVIDVVATTMATVGNPSSVHSAGRAASAVVEEARVKVAALAGARARDVVFCSGGTEANNAVIAGAGAKSLLVSTIEHDSVLAAAKVTGLPVFELPVDKDGVLILDAVEAVLAGAPKPALISVMYANNEMGALQPIEALSEVAKAHGAMLHCDAIQAAGKVNIDVAQMGCTYLTLSSHKIGGPQGVGAIVLAPTAPMKPTAVGGGQEMGRRSGTENVAGVAGFGVAALSAMAAVGDAGRLRVLRDRLESELKAYSNDIEIVAELAERTPNTSCIVLPGVKGETQVMHFDLAGICISSGAACSSGKVKVSHVLSGMGYSDDKAISSARVSLGYKTTDAHVDAFITAWKKLYDRTAGRS